MNGKRCLSLCPSASFSISSLCFLICLNVCRFYVFDVAFCRSLRFLFALLFDLFYHLLCLPFCFCFLPLLGRSWAAFALCSARGLLSALFCFTLLCSLLSARCSAIRSALPLLCALCSALCSLLSALYSLLSAPLSALLCSLLCSALRSALCSLRSALRSFVFCYCFRFCFWCMIFAFAISCVRFVWAMCFYFCLYCLHLLFGFDLASASCFLFLSFLLSMRFVLSFRSLFALCLLFFALVWFV